MRTNIEIDDALVVEAMALTGLPTKRAVVHEALETLVRVRSRKSLLDLRGRITFADGYDHKALREGGR
ncbi:MAG: type II toxin-antitoxin system VapB family antitoxin [Pseudomonadota bacterium]